MISALNAQLEHANLRVNHSLDRLLRLLFVTPDMHKVHHSRLQRETDTNYANIFSFWDRLFGTYSPNLRLTELSYGLEGFEKAEKQNLRALLLLPFRTYG
jgi:sterol desaturase/sphingolipid hydroxylase (fatty acid hydroxylase superfamily)